MIIMTMRRSTTSRAVGAFASTGPSDGPGRSNQITKRRATVSVPFREWLDTNHIRRARLATTIGMDCRVRVRLCRRGGGCCCCCGCGWCPFLWSSRCCYGYCYGFGGLVCHRLLYLLLLVVVLVLAILEHVGPGPWLVKCSRPRESRHWLFLWLVCYCCVYYCGYYCCYYYGWCGYYYGGDCSGDETTAAAHRQMSPPSNRPTPFVPFHTRRISQPLVAAAAFVVAFAVVVVAFAVVVEKERQSGPHDKCGCVVVVPSTHLPLVLWLWLGFSNC